nr:unnamed protein product [Callosobruchus analis]
MRHICYPSWTFMDTCWIFILIQILSTMDDVNEYQK